MVAVGRQERLNALSTLAHALKRETRNRQLRTATATAPVTCIVGDKVSWSGTGTGTGTVQ